MSTTRQPDQRTTRRGWRPQRVLLGSILTLLLAATAFAAVHYLRTDKDKERTYLSTDGWPQLGQGAYVLGDGHFAVSPNQHPVPIASLAKVMTAYLVLKHYPLDAT